MCSDFNLVNPLLDLVQCILRVPGRAHEFHLLLEAFAAMSELPSNTFTAVNRWINRPGRTCARFED